MASSGYKENCYPHEAHSDQHHHRLFRGAGKTTSILSLLARKPDNEKWAILINEFGNIGVDGAILDQQGAIVKEVPGGGACAAWRACRCLLASMRC